ncbi:MAG: hypothetical protein MJ138_04600 [Kiritimatiellae bacterium]|nr:hypothetical protein [Kiritimatiellia bacterium]
MNETKKKILAAAGLVAATAAAAAEWPLLTLRHTSALNEHVETVRQLVEAQKRHPGCCDEIWFAAGGRLTPENVRKNAEAFARFRPLCEEAGIAVGYQQGVTLGHDSNFGKSPRDFQFATDVWQRDRNGNKMGMLCPRAPETLQYEYEYAKTIMETAKPVSYWLDDDMRLGFCKPAGCFCDRCVKAFNEEFKHSFTRAELAGRIFGGPQRDPVRAEWCRFNAESLAIYGAAAARAADDVLPACRVAYQAVRGDYLYNGTDFRPLLEALKGKKRASTGIRPGDLVYTEDSPREFVGKALRVMREAERCKTYGDLVGTVCYEQETYPRKVFHKSPDAIVTECMLALASGCDTLSLYWYSATNPEPVEDFERFCKAIAAARPTFTRMSENARKTHLAGVARFVGSAAAERIESSILDDDDLSLALTGIPVTAMEAGLGLWYVNLHSLHEMGAGDVERLERGRVLFAGPAWAAFKKDHPDAAPKDGGKWATVPTPSRFPLCSERKAWLDAIDEVTDGKFPVRVDLNHPLRILPRVDAEGRLVQLTLMNCSIGDAADFTVRLRDKNGERERPVSRVAGWHPLTLFAGDGL